MFLSKTEAMFSQRSRTEYSDADASRHDCNMDVLDDVTNGSLVGFIDLTKEFKRLGSIVNYSLLGS